MHVCTLKQLQFLVKVQDYALLIILPQFRANVSLFESVICCQLSYGFFSKPECYMINVLKIIAVLSLKYLTQSRVTDLLSY